MYKKYFEQIAENNNLQLDKQSGVIFGEKNGYEVLISHINSSNQFVLSVSVCRADELPTVEDMKSLVKSSKVLVKPSIQRHIVNFIIKTAITTKKTIDNIREALDNVTQFLRENSYENCCQSCGKAELTDPYIVSGAEALLCSSCFASYSQTENLDEQQEKHKGENFIAGVVGAFIGSLIGVISIVLLGQLGYVAAISGVIMAVCALKGYELLGGKLSVKGIIVSVLLMLVMVYIANWIDWAIYVSSYCEIDIMTAFQYIPDLISEGYIEAGGFYGNMGMVYLFALLGAVPTIKNAVQNKKSAHITYKMCGETTQTF